MREPTTGTLTIRQAGPKDAPELNALFQSMYANSSHPFQSILDVEEFLRDERNVEVVVEEHGQIAAGAAMTYCQWNDSYELGRAITRPDFRRRGYAGVLVDRAVRAVCERKSGSVFFGFPRVQRTLEICVGLDPKFVAVGHDGGRNVVDGSRELHLIMYAVPRYARFVHVAPSVAKLFQSAFLDNDLYDAMGLASIPGDYPPSCFVGPPTRGHLDTGFRFEYDPHSPSCAIEIIGYTGEAETPARLCARLERFLLAHPRVEHATVTVLANNIGLIQELQNQGFEVAAYLPAWYPSGRYRFDCVQLVRASFRGTPQVQGFADTLATLRSELPRIFNSHSGIARAALTAATVGNTHD